MAYQAYGQDHHFRCYVPHFQTDPAVGTFVATTSPASLDALATELTAVIKPLYATDSMLSWGDWIGEQHVGGPTSDSFVPLNNGTITAATASFSGSTSPTQAVGQGTWSFRDADSKLMRFVNIGLIYVTPTVYRYGGLGGGFKDFADYVLGSNVILSRLGFTAAAMVSLTFDTNDGLTRRYRR
jgi:hypothetical protein